MSGGVSCCVYNIFQAGNIALLLNFTATNFHSIFQSFFKAHNMMMMVMGAVAGWVRCSGAEDSTDDNFVRCILQHTVMECARRKTCERMRSKAFERVSSSWNEHKIFKSMKIKKMKRKSSKNEPHFSTIKFCIASCRLLLLIIQYWREIWAFLVSFSFSFSSTSEVMRIFSSESCGDVGCGIRICQVSCVILEAVQWVLSKKTSYFAPWTVISCWI